MAAIKVLVLDVNETLSDLEPLRARFTAAGLAEESLDTWFAATLRDGFALTAADSYAGFRTIGGDVLKAQLAAAGLEPSEDVVTGILSGFTELSTYPDVAPGLRRLRELGIRLVTLTNGAARMSERMFTEAGVLDLLEYRLDVETTGKWKPHHAAYEYAANVCGVSPEQMALVAVHPWDVDGARRAGLRGWYLDRRGTPYPEAFLAPDLIASDLVELATVIEEDATR
ncbi:2-haloacid dehalogenase [Kribbella amoyensis]|uniref:2-haloacid dehalogenase n=1 Tax=Kribbella amoyensis TaxID=996641 RepID=A0A561BQD8_9ACTN|nr:haloacid dehalogenase type II [Kribbella amoyensis]TWD81034.1 2-haloacid dehalogenase [Kribbella amoyensis]